MTPRQSESSAGLVHCAGLGAELRLPQNLKRHAGVTNRVNRPGALPSASCPGCDFVLGLPLLEMP
jgi:hypothetical protein